MTRITQSQLSRMSITGLMESRDRYDKISNEVSSGRKVSAPGDSSFSASINQYHDTLTKIEGHETRLKSAKSILDFQQNVSDQLNDLLVRAQEIATQSSNETVGLEARAQASKEAFEIRDHIVQLANSKYQGRYIYGGASDEEPPFDEGNVYTVPSGSGSETKRYVYDDITSQPGNAQSRTINLTDDFTMSITTPGNSLFSRALGGLEKLGRALSGYSTPASSPFTGTAYSLPTEVGLQTRDIKDSMDALVTARQQDVMPERISLGAKLNRLDTAEALLGLAKTDAKTMLASLQDADLDVSATNFSLAQQGLNAAYAVSSKVLQLSILNFL